VYSRSGVHGSPSLWRVGGIAAVVAAAANAVLYVGARAVGVPLELTEVFETEFQRVPVSSFVLATLLEGGLVATVTAAACRRWAARPRRWFVALAMGGTFASLSLPLVSDGTAATIVVLCLSHVMAALVLVPPLLRVLPQRPNVAGVKPS
jgi:hypothetical protein